MSRYQFFASNAPIKEYDNLKIKKITIHNESAIYMKTPMDEWHGMRIIQEEDLTLTAPYTGKPYCNFLEWYYNDENAEIIVEFVKEHLATNASIELWNTWLEDRSAVRKRKIPVQDLKVEDIRELWGQDSFVQNECLVVYKAYGK